MLDEVKLDTSQKKLNFGKRLNERGLQEYQALLIDAVTSQTEDWLANQLKAKQCMKTHETRETKKGVINVAVPVTAAETFAQGEFNRFYIRGLCLRAIDNEVDEVEVYRAKYSENPRPESEQMIGKRFKSKEVLDALRISIGTATALGFPDPGTGLTIKLC
jgi:hypothetical protein